MKTFANISYGEYKANLLDLYLPDCEEFPVYIHFHGGGIEGGSKGSVENPPLFAQYLTAHGIAAVSAEYRMYPAAAYPDFVRDSAAAVAWVKKNIGQYGKCSKIFIGGSSAGGYLSMMLCYDKKWLAPYHIDPSELGGFIHNAGQPTTHYNVVRERGLDSRRVIVDDAAPMFYIGLSKEYAPMKFIVADNDIPARYEQTMLMIAAMKDFGYDMNKVEHQVMHGTHTSYDNARDETGESVYGKILEDFIKRHTAE